MEEQCWLLLCVGSARLPLDGSSTLGLTILPSQFGVTSKHAEGPLCPTLLTINKEIKALLRGAEHAEQAAPRAGGWRGKAWGPAMCPGCDCGSGVSVSLQESFWGGVTSTGLFLLGKILSVHLLLSPSSSHCF